MRAGGGCGGGRPVSRRTVGGGVAGCGWTKISAGCERRIGMLENGQHRDLLDAEAQRGRQS